jgi:hypothetical protein
LINLKLLSSASTAFTIEYQTVANRHGPACNARLRTFQYLERAMCCDTAQHSRRIVRPQRQLICHQANQPLADNELLIFRR